jgi:hypothetical protein
LMRKHGAGQAASVPKIPRSAHVGPHRVENGVQIEDLHEGRLRKGSG